MLVARALARRFSAAAATPPADLSRYGAVLGGARMDEACARAFDTWHGCVAGAQQDAGAPLAVERLRDVVADDCVFKPPTYYTPWAGRPRPRPRGGRTCRSSRGTRASP